MKKILLSFLLLTTISTQSHSAWFNDGYGLVSNFCRSGFHWQIVSWNYVGTDCYMPGWGVWGKRVAE